MQRLEVSGAVRPICGSLGVKRLIKHGVEFITFYSIQTYFVSYCEINSKIRL